MLSLKEEFSNALVEASDEDERRLEVEVELVVWLETSFGICVTDVVLWKVSETVDDGAFEFDSEDSLLVEELVADENREEYINVDVIRSEYEDVMSSLDVGEDVNIAEDSVDVVCGVLVNSEEPVYAEDREVKLGDIAEGVDVEKDVETLSSDDFAEAEYNEDDGDKDDERIDKDGVMTENEVVVGPYCELSICCPLDWPLIEDDIKVYVEDTEKDEYKLSSETVFEVRNVETEVLDTGGNDVRLPCWGVKVEEGVDET